MDAKRWIVRFEDGRAEMRDLLGGKGAGVAEMTRIGLPVPPGFTITTEACVEFLRAGEQFPHGLRDQVRAAMHDLSAKMCREFGADDNPLLVSVRSGAKFSMPGMMDTILNLGFTAKAVQALTAQTNDERFAWDAYRRLVQMFGKVVLHVDSTRFDVIIEDIRHQQGVTSDPEVSAEGWKQAVERFKGAIKDAVGVEFPEDPWIQLEMAVQAVFCSWNGKRAVDYRNATGLAHDLGTAVNIQAMVFGNVGWDSGSGVAFTRNPATGEKHLFGEYLANAQGEDVVNGSRTPIPVARMESEMPDAYRQLVEIAGMLEQHYRDLQDMEFTVEHGKLWMLQTRSGKRTAAAAVKVAAEMVGEGLISKSEAVMRVSAAQIDQLLHPRFDPQGKQQGRLLTQGLNASPGAAVGQVTFDSETAERLNSEGKAVILVRQETTPDDVHGMLAARGILTQRGGATSHAAVVARQLGKPCVSGCEAISIDLSQRQFSINGTLVHEGEVLSLDGADGTVYLGSLPTIAPRFEEEADLQKILAWADEVRKLEVWANADSGAQAAQARRYGAQGIGLCRTEHMFLGERTAIFQRAILAHASGDEATFQAILDDQLLKLQRCDFYEMFRAMDGLPVVIRLLDPPLHEFLPSIENLLQEVTMLQVTEDAAALLECEFLLQTVRDLTEFNPMLGLRGCRLGIMLPALNLMQVRAIFEAACDAAREGCHPRPEIMVPLTSHVNELKQIQPVLDGVAQQVMRARGLEIPYRFGTMVEIPRAALTAGEIAEVAEFFSFGTNDLTQMTYGISRDDAERKFLLDYVSQGILPENPFQILDQSGVGQLMQMAATAGRNTRPDLKLGICGEHGGEPQSIEFCHRLGLNYVSCSPYRIPIARLAAAHAALGLG